MKPNNAINADSKHARAFGALVFAAGYGGRYAVRELKMTKIMATALLLTAMAACSRAPSDFDKQSQKYWEQAAAADEQIKVMAEQQKKVEEQQKLAEDQLRRNEELLRRNEAIAERWEKIQGRYERLLSAMEKQFKVQ